MVILTVRGPVVSWQPTCPPSITLEFLCLQLLGCAPGLGLDSTTISPPRGSLPSLARWAALRPG